MSLAYSSEPTRVWRGRYRLPRPAALLALGVLAGCGGAAPTEAAGAVASAGDSVAPVAAPGAAHDPTSPTLVMRNVQFRFTKDLVVGIDRIRALMTPTAPGGVVTFDDPASFALDVDGASIRLTLAQAQVLMNERVFSFPGANVHDLKLSGSGASLVINGRLRKGATIPFTTTGTLSLRGGRWLAVDTKSVKIGDVGVTGLLGALHVTLQSMINTPASGQMRVEGNTILIDVLSVLPPPHIHGTVASVDCCARGIGLVIGSPAPVSDSALRDLVPSAMRSPNFIAIRSGQLRFGKLTMSDADLDLVDADASDAFDFFLAQYQCQLVAGDAHTTMQYGWRVTMPDYARIPPARCRTG